MDLEKAVSSQSDKSKVENWELTDDQMFFLMQRHNAIFVAYENDDMDYLLELQSSGEYESVFGEMNIDEAIDRYECMLEEDSEAT